ncbi:MAG: hypothetical protein FIA95_09380 [Gemmatimonadetes bacterium]|nr:hypothetical protein [Gemmatimonadota bacterium]
MFPTDLRGPAFVAIGEIALLLIGFSVAELSAAVAHGAARAGSREGLLRSACVWEAAARNAWLLGVLAAILGFVVQMSLLSSGLEGLVRSLAGRTAPALYGLLLAAVCGLVSLRVSSKAPPGAPAESAMAPGAAAWRRIETWAGYLLLAAGIVWSAAGAGEGAGLGPADWLLRWPAWLTGVGASLLVALYLGPGSASTAIGWSGGVAALVGLTGAGRGFASSSIELVAGGLTFTLCACFVSLLGMAAVAFPLHDHAAREPGAGGRWRSATKLAWWGLPLVGLLALVVTIVLVMVPMKAPME